MRTIAASVGPISSHQYTDTRLAEDRDGNVNNVGYPESAPANADETGTGYMLPSTVSAPRYLSEIAQTGWRCGPPLSRKH